MLRTRTEDPWAVLEVTDTGVGMTDEVRERVFDAFGLHRTVEIDFDPVDGKHFIRLSFAVSTPEVEEVPVTVA